MERNGKRPTAGQGRGAVGVRDNDRCHTTVAFAEKEGGPEGVVGGAAGTSSQTNGRAGGGGSAVSVAAASSTEKVEKETTGGAGGTSKHDQASTSTFAEQDWRALEPDLTQFCHKVACSWLPFSGCYASLWAVFGHSRDSRNFISP